MHSLIFKLSLLMVLVVISAPTTYGAVPLLMNYQARLTDTAGAPINDTLDFEFNIYIDSTTPIPEWTEVHIDLKISNGAFDIGFHTGRIEVQLASFTPFPDDLFDNDELWLGITIGSDPEISPRTRLVTVPYSFVTSRINGDIKTEPNKITVAEIISDTTGKIASYVFTPDSIVFSNYDEVSPIFYINSGVQIKHTDHDTTVEITAGGIFMPQSTLRSTDEKTVPERELVIKSGELILFGKYAGTEIKIDGGDILILTENDFLQYIGIDSSGIKMSNPASPDPKVELNANGTFFIWNPGKTDTVISFTPGSATFKGIPVEFVGGSGTISAINGTLKVAPPNDGAGGRVIVTPEVVHLTDDVGTDSVTIHRTDGLILVLGASGTSAVYNAAGVQLTGPTARAFAANPNSVTTTRPSTNTAWSYDLDDAADLYYCDLDDDAVRDISFQHTPSKELRLESGTGFVCDGPTSLTTCNVSGAATYASTVAVSGAMTCSGSLACKSGVTFDPNDDATDDIIITGGATPTLTLAVGTGLDCLGPAFFSSPVLMASDLIVVGVKSFVQDHPEDETKEIVYVALEGHEAGTYTRGGGQLSDGISIIELPEEFSLVTNKEGLTAQITPRGPVQSMLYVESVTPTLLVVKASSKKDGDVKFDFMINGIRAGFENHQVIREKRSYASNN